MRHSGLASSNRTTQVSTDPRVTIVPSIGPVRGTAMYFAAVLGPGVLTLPALAAQQAGPAFLITLVALLALSAPLASTLPPWDVVSRLRGDLPAM